MDFGRGVPQSTAFEAPPSNAIRLGSGTQLVPDCAPGFALTFVVYEEEGSVLNNRTAERSAELVVVKRIL